MLQLILIKKNFLYFKEYKFYCAVGINGITQNKKEGDGCTPYGEYKINKIYYRADKLDILNLNHDLTEIYPDDGWCDDPASELYNQFIRFPFDGSAERLYRRDDLYDLVCVLNYNTNPIIPGKGSAIFLHICKNNFEHTEGCVALEKKVLLRLSQKIDTNSKIIIEG